MVKKVEVVYCSGCGEAFECGERMYVQLSKETDSDSGLLTIGDVWCINCCPLSVLGRFIFLKNFS